MELNIEQIEWDAIAALDAIGFPLDELAAENILAAWKLDIITADNAALERQLLSASIAAGRSVLLKETAEVA